MKDSRNLIIVGLVVLCLGFCWHSSSQPKHPFLHWLGTTASRLVWVAPFFFDEGPKEEQEPRFTLPQYAYGETPVRAKGIDGEYVIEHGDNW